MAICVAGKATGHVENERERESESEREMGRGIVSMSETIENE